MKPTCRRDPPAAWTQSALRAIATGAEGSFEIPIRLVPKTVEPFVKRQVAEIMVKEHGISIARAYGVVKLSRTAWYRRLETSTERDREVIEALNGIVEKKPRWGSWKCFDRLRLDGRGWNHKRVHRVYCALLRLNLPRRTKRQLPTRLRQPLVAPDHLNAIWALDFMADSLYGWRPFRTLNVIDEGNREALGTRSRRRSRGSELFA